MRLRFSSILAVLLVAALAACGDAASRKDERELPTDVTAETPVMGPQRSILAFGDSLFAGYGVVREDSYPAKLEAALRARGVNARVTNAGVSGDTTAAALQRLSFTLDSMDEKPQLAIVELGGNDLLRGIGPEETEANLRKILQELGKRDIRVILMGMRAPRNLGADYQARFDAIYPGLAREFDSALVPFFLEPVYDRPALIQADRIHPNEEGIAELVGATVGEVEGALPPSNAS